MIQRERVVNLREPKISHRFVQGFLWLILLAYPLSAQSPGAESRKSSGGRLAWIIAVSLPEGLANPVEVKAGDETSQLELSKRSIGPPVKIPEDGMIRLVGEIPNPEDPDKPFRGTIAQARIPETVEDALVILIPLREPADQLMFEVKVKDLADFKGGDTLYLNTSPREIQVESRGEKIQVGTGEMRVDASPKAPKVESISVTYSFMDPRKQAWSSLGTSMLVVRPTRREICIFSWDPRLERIDYHGVTFPVSE